MLLFRISSGRWVARLVPFRNYCGFNGSKTELFRLVSFHTPYITPESLIYHIYNKFLTEKPILVTITMVVKYPF